jgi:hypothetical protein
MDARKRHLRGALNSIEFPLELTRKTEVNQSMKYIHSSKFKAIGVALVTAAAVATATPGVATPSYHVTDTTGHMTDPTGGMTDTTGPKVTDTSGTSLHPGNKKEAHYSLNQGQTAAVQRLISLLAQASSNAQSSNPTVAAQGQAQLTQLLPIARQLLASIVVRPGGGSYTSLTSPKPEPKVTDTTGPKVTDTTGPKVTDTSGTSLNPGSKSEPRVVNAADLARAQALLAKLNTLAKGSTLYNATLVELKLVAVALGSSSGFSIPNSGW